MGKENFGKRETKSEKLYTAEAAGACAIEETRRATFAHQHQVPKPAGTTRDFLIFFQKKRTIATVLWTRR